MKMLKKSQKQARLFSSKHKVGLWIHANCHKCQRILGGWKECRLSYYMFEGLSTRQIPKDVAQEIGLENNKLVQKCSKFEEKENGK